MTQKSFSVLFVIVLFLVVGVMVVTKYKNADNTSASASPSPSTDLAFFGASPKAKSQQNGSISDQLNQSLNQNTNNSQSQQQVQGAQKQMKQYSVFPGVLPDDQLQNKKAVIETNKGTIEFEIYPSAPKAASNFIFLANDTFYDGLTFHRVVPGFVIQGGDPSGNGTGGPGYTFKEDQVSGKYDRGIVAMAKTSDEPAGTGGSQFFIMLADNPLPPDYVIFGKVISGMDVVDKIQVGDVMERVYIQPLK